MEHEDAILLINDSPDLTPGQVEKIPLGLLLLDSDGKVLGHEDSHRRSVVSHNLFTTVVPFTQVRGFQECYQGFLASGDSGRVFNLTFSVNQTREIQVQVFFGRICAEIAMVRIKVV